MEVIFYSFLVGTGFLALIGVSFILWRREKQNKYYFKEVKTYPFVPKIEPTDLASTIPRTPLYRVPEDLDMIIPVGSKRAVICEWDKNQKPTRAAFRAKGGDGKIVTAIVVKVNGMTLFLRHKMAEPMFQRPLVG